MRLRRSYSIDTAIVPDTSRRTVIRTNRRTAAPSISRIRIFRRAGVARLDRLVDHVAGQPRHGQLEHLRAEREEDRRPQRARGTGARSPSAAAACRGTGPSRAGRSEGRSVVATCRGQRAMAAEPFPGRSPTRGPRRPRGPACRRRRCRPRPGRATGASATAATRRRRTGTAARAARRSAGDERRVDARRACRSSGRPRGRCRVGAKPFACEPGGAVDRRGAAPIGRQPGAAAHHGPRPARPPCAVARAAAPVGGEPHDHALPVVAVGAEPARRAGGSVRESG